MCIRDRIGTSLGIYTFTYFKGIGKIDTVISLAYMYILAIIGTLMLVESLREIDRAKRNIIIKKKLHVHYWIHGLPLRMRFPKSKLYESIFTPILIGLLVGFIAAMKPTTNPIIIGVKILSYNFDFGNLILKGSPWIQ